jgi:uncharacterized protein (TIGR02996 family)
MSRDDAFLQAIREDPDDDVPRLIYADWLEEQGDPRGEFIRVDCALEHLPATDRRRPPLLARRRQLLAQHRGAWLGPLRPLAYHWEFRRGFPEEMTADARPFLDHAGRIFAAAPVRLARLLHGGTVTEALAECRHLRRLCSLHLTDNGLGDDGLRTLLASPHLGGLRCLRLGNNDLGDEGAALLARAAGLVGLTSLTLSRNAIGDEGAAALAGSRHLGNLTALDLGNNGIQDAGARALAEAAGLPRLVALDLSNPAGGYFRENGFGPRARQKLRERFGDGVRLPRQVRVRL